MSKSEFAATIWSQIANSPVLRALSPEERNAFKAALANATSVLDLSAEHQSILAQAQQQPQ